MQSRLVYMFGSILSHTSHPSNPGSVFETYTQSVHFLTYQLPALSLTKDGSNSPISVPVSTAVCMQPILNTAAELSV